MRKRELFEWLAHVLKNLVIALIRGDRSALAFVLIAVPVILLVLWAYSRLGQRFAAMRRRTPLPVEEASQDRWSPPALDEVARIVNAKPLAKSHGEVPRVSP